MNKSKRKQLAQELMTRLFYGQEFPPALQISMPRVQMVKKLPVCVAFGI